MPDVFDDQFFGDSNQFDITLFTVTVIAVITRIKQILGFTSRQKQSLSFTSRIKKVEDKSI